MEQAKQQRVKRELERILRRFNHDLELFRTDAVGLLPPVMMSLSIALTINLIWPNPMTFITLLCVSLTGIFFTLLFDERLANPEWLCWAPSSAALVAALHGEELRDLDYITNDGSLLWNELAKQPQDDEKKLVICALSLLSFYAAHRQSEQSQNDSLTHSKEVKESTTESCSTTTFVK